MQDINAGKDPQVKAAALLTSYSQQLKNLSELINSSMLTDETVRAGYHKEYADTLQRLNEVRNLVGGGIGLSKASAAPTGGSSLVSPSLIAAEKKLRGL